jgi:uncharacterized protein HemX
VNYDPQEETRTPIRRRNPPTAIVRTTPAQTATDAVRRAKAAALKWVVGIATALILAAVTGAHTMIVAHEVRITKVETELSSAKDMLKHIIEKLDRLIERNQR